MRQNNPKHACNIMQPSLAVRFMKASISSTEISLAAPALHKFDIIFNHNNCLQMSEMHPVIQQDDLMTHENI